MSGQQARRAAAQEAAAAEADLSLNEARDDGAAALAAERER